MAQSTKSTKYIINHENIAEVYEEFYKYYELNHEWWVLDFLQFEISMIRTLVTIVVIDVVPLESRISRLIIKNNYTFV